jgi:hypothetical protein
VEGHLQPGHVHILLSLHHPLAYNLIEC